MSAKPFLPKAAMDSAMRALFLLGRKRC